MKVKARKSFKTWITKDKPSKKKQKLYEKYLKNRNLATYKTQKNLFETIKRKSKKNYYSEKILSFKSDPKKTWKTIKDLIGKTKMNKSSLPQKVRVKKTGIFDQEKIAIQLNRFFAICPIECWLYASKTDSRKQKYI